MAPSPVQIQQFALLLALFILAKADPATFAALAAAYGAMTAHPPR